MFLSIIVCTDAKGGIGLNGSIPWFIKEDLIHFKELTTNRYVIAGRVTWDSIPDRSGKGIKLPNRTPVVVTSDSKYKVVGGMVVPSLLKALKSIPNNYYDEIFIIGGEQLYREALPYANKIYLTELNSDFKCDRFFPKLDESEWRVKNSGEWVKHSSGVKYRFKELIKKV